MGVEPGTQPIHRGVALRAVHRVGEEEALVRVEDEAVEVCAHHPRLDHVGVRTLGRERHARLGLADQRDERLAWRVLEPRSRADEVPARRHDPTELCDRRDRAAPLRRLGHGHTPRPRAVGRHDATGLHAEADPLDRLPEFVHQPELEPRFTRRRLGGRRAAATLGGWVGRRSGEDSPRDRDARHSQRAALDRVDERHDELIGAQPRRRALREDEPRQLYPATGSERPEQERTKVHLPRRVGTVATAGFDHILGDAPGQPCHDHETLLVEAAAVNPIRQRARRE
ncbi:MAG TPA: hypothetical protein DEF51_10380 [Myxococcales bacterium]|nr:hypothetical protein [Myxococcales bacterium]